MPAQQGKSNLFGKYAGRATKAVAEHADDPTDYGQMRVPPGITNGVARLTKCGFGQVAKGDNAGELYFRAEGAILEPEFVVVNGRETRCRGLHTSIMESCWDTQIKSGPNAGKTITFEEHLANVLNEMRKLGGDQFTSGADASDLERLAKDLEEMQPYFHFSTTERKPRPGSNDPPGVWENWYGSKGLENYTPPDPDADPLTATRDATAAPAAGAAKTQPATAPANRVQQAASTKPNGAPPKSPPPTRQAAAPPAKAPEPPAPEYSDGEDLDALVERAAADDGPAQARLTELAVNAGYTEEETKAADDWAAVVEMINNPKTADGTEGGDQNGAGDAATHVVAVNETYKFFPPTKGPGGKVGKAKKAIEVDVKKVNARARTAEVLNLEDSKTVYKDVPWDDLVAG